MTELCWVMFCCAAQSFLLFCWNLFYFRCPRRIPEDCPKISVLIPARDEEHSIGDCLVAVLASKHVELEIIVLDDHSTDGTREIVNAIAALEPRVRCVESASLPVGWCGKQFACWQLARRAKHEYLAFLDADVRLKPDGLARLVGFQQDRGAPLVSAFPRQIVETEMERLIVPMIHFILLCYLPMWGMRHFRLAGFGAGCGQLFLATRDEYFRIGGHELVKDSMHDGVMLPRAYRQAGDMTDLCDGSGLAECRMYSSASQVWLGFAKNAREGIAKPPLIFVFTALLLLGHVLPPICLLFHFWLTGDQIVLLVATTYLSMMPRWPFLKWEERMVFDMALHPIGVLMFLAIQWYAKVRYWMGRPVGWKGRVASEPAT